MCQRNSFSGTNVTPWGLCGGFYTYPPPSHCLEAPAAGKLVSRTNVEPDCALTSARVWPTCPPAGVPSAASQPSRDRCSRYTCLLNKQHLIPGAGGGEDKGQGPLGAVTGRACRGGGNMAPKTSKEGHECLESNHMPQRCRHSNRLTGRCRMGLRRP